MESFPVVDFLDKVPYIFECIIKCVVFIQINLLLFQSFNEAFRKSIIVWISFSRHADQYAMLF
jgi:hypothetical protein